MFSEPTNPKTPVLKTGWYTIANVAQDRYLDASPSDGQLTTVPIHTETPPEWYIVSDNWVQATICHKSEKFLIHDEDHCTPLVGARKGSNGNWVLKSVKGAKDTFFLAYHDEPKYRPIFLGLLPKGNRFVYIGPKQGLTEANPDIYKWRFTFVTETK